MSPTAKDLFTDALSLPDSERAALAAWLIESLDEDAQAAWQSEVALRLSQLDDGSVTPILWDKARKMILGTADGASNR